MYELDKDAMLEVMEQVGKQLDVFGSSSSIIFIFIFLFICLKTEGSRLQGEMLKKELMSRVDVNLENPRSELYAIFSNIDDQGRNNLRLVVVYIPYTYGYIIPSIISGCFDLDGTNLSFLCTSWASNSVARSGSRYSGRSILIMTTW